MLTHQFRELTRYLHEFNELQLDRLSIVCCGSERAQDFLCDLVRRFVHEEHVRRYRRAEPPRYLVVAEQPETVLRAASHDARVRAIEVAAGDARNRLTAAELLPVSVFLEQLAARLERCVQPGSAAS